MKSSGYSVFRIFAFVMLFGIAFRPSTTWAQRPLGTDVSGYQAATLDWTTARNAGGVRFA